MIHNKSLLELFSVKRNFLHETPRQALHSTASAATPKGCETFIQLDPIPGYPEGIVADRGRVYVCGPATFDQTAGKSQILVHDESNGEKITTIEVSGEDLSQSHAVSCSASDGNGRIYVLTAQLSPTVPPAARLGVLRFRRHANFYVQEQYAEPIPVLPGSPAGTIPLPNDIIFDDDGNAYVSDSFQATIWRIPPGGGSPEVWLQDEKLRGVPILPGLPPIGVNGMRLDPERNYMYFSVSFPASNPAAGAIYRVPFADAPDALAIEEFYRYDAIMTDIGPFSTLPDGIAFGASGNLYVALAAANAISVIDPTGVEINRITSSPADTSSIPLDGPASIAFHNDSKSLLVTNHSPLFNIKEHFAVLKIYVNDVESPLCKPMNLP